MQTINDSLGSIAIGNKERLIEKEALSEFNRNKVKQLLGKTDEEMVKELQTMKSIQDLINLIIIRVNLNHIQYYIDQTATTDLKPWEKPIEAFSFSQIIIGSIFNDTIQKIKDQIPCWRRGQKTERLENIIAKVCLDKANLGSAKQLNFTRLMSLFD